MSRGGCVQAERHNALGHGLNAFYKANCVVLVLLAKQTSSNGQLLAKLIASRSSDRLGINWL
jgi:hypothetical protein